MNRKHILSTLCASLLLFEYGAASILAAVGPKYEAIKLTESGTIVGVVRFDGPAPAPRSLEVSGDDKICHQEPIPAEDLVVSSDGKIRWAVASIKKIKKGKPFSAEDPENPVALNQKGCRFVPHVIVVPTGRTFRILNSDGILHNTHLLPKKNGLWNKAMPPQVKHLDTKFKRSERIPVKCDVHAWMKGWIIVTDHPYCEVTGPDGTFRMENVPVGTQTLEVWHETLGKLKQQVTVKAGEETALEFVFKKK